MLNVYARHYRSDQRPKPNEEFAFISYLDEPNTFSVVAVKRLMNVDNFGKGTIRERQKNYRIHVEKKGTLAEMEKLAEESEIRSAYTMNTDVVSDTEEWHKRKKASSNNKTSNNNFDNILDAFDSFDLPDCNRTYTDMTSCFADADDTTCNVNNRRVTFDEIENIDPDESNDSFDFQPDDEATRRQESAPTVPFQSTNQNKRTVSTVSRRPATKRTRSRSSVSSPSTHDTEPTGGSSLSHVKELDHNIVQLRKQLTALSDCCHQQQKIMNSILHNQKKMAKAMRMHRIPILLSDETVSSSSNTVANSDTIIYQGKNGEQIDLLKISCDRTKPNKFVLAAIERIFKDEKELVAIDPRVIDSDERVSVIRDAVQTKFSLSHEELSTVWIQMLECIKSKRRNVKAKLKKATGITQNDTGMCNTTLIPVLQSMDST